MLEEILRRDAEISRAMAVPSLEFCNGWLDLRTVFLVIEWSVHGIPWLIGVSVATFVAFRHNWKFSTQYKLAVLGFGILLDLGLVGLIKISVRRNRPPYNRDDQIYEAPVADKYSFPSGHSSRAAMLTVFAITLCENVSLLYLIPFAIVFPIVLGTSRIIMGRHYVSDVIAGLTLGCVEAFIALQLPHVVVKCCARLMNKVLDSIGL
ncbi:PAP2 superfamily domain-containing protein [Ditylenchus destructor]|uniref:PAP2 superfamily domain-containing protein n=1 Tax=Ditylenchus destructor TaxID=166010 RepID=A0AAD4N8Y0_9BILA|nr:PAP2 superfamily domain-containing protein [Ditylenchus destructor]